MYYILQNNVTEEPARLFQYKTRIHIGMNPDTNLDESYLINYIPFFVDDSILDEMFSGNPNSQTFRTRIYGLRTQKFNNNLMLAVSTQDLEYQHHNFEEMLTPFYLMWELNIPQSCRTTIEHLIETTQESLPHIKPE